jgi:hypothetical protein
MLCLPYYDSVFSSPKLEISSEQVLPGSEGENRRGLGRGWGGETTQTTYALVNK